MKKALVTFLLFIILGIGVFVAYLDSRASRIAEHNARITAAQQAMPAPTVTPTPTPTPIKPAKIAPKQAQKPAEVANTECKDMNGNIFMTTLEKCLTYHEQNKPQPTTQS